jgi:hypothetical protein
VYGTRERASDSLNVVGGQVVDGWTTVGPPENRGEIKDDQDRENEHETKHLFEPPFVGRCN